MRREKRHIYSPFKNDVRLRFLVILGGIFSLLFIVITPPLAGFDEAAHFTSVVYYLEGQQQTSERSNQKTIRAVKIDQESAVAIWIAAHTQSQLLKTGQSHPSAYKDLLVNDGKTNVMVRTDLAGDAVYSPIAFLPSILGAGLGKMLGLPILFQVYSARLFNVLTYLTLLFLAISLIPFGRWALLIVGLLPMALFEAATVSADALLIGLVAFIMSSVLFLRNKGVPSSKSNTVLVFSFVAAIALALSKPTYVLVVLLFALLPKQIFSSTVKWIVITLGLIAVPLAMAAAWNAHISNYAAKIGAAYRPGFAVSADNQVADLRAHPLHILTVGLKTVYLKGYELFGQSIGTFDPSFVMLPIIVSLPLLALFLYGTFLAEKKDSVSMDCTGALNIRARLLVVLVLCTTMLGICAALYLTYTPVGGDIVDGLQGRYFTPLYVLLIPALYGLIRVPQEQKSSRLFLWGGAAVLVVACMQIILVCYRLSIFTL